MPVTSFVKVVTDCKSTSYRFRIASGRATPKFRGYIHTPERINTARLSEIAIPERLVSIDLEVENFKSPNHKLPDVDGYDYVVTEDGHLFLVREDLG
jgi:hypothetical protein